MARLYEGPTASSASRPPLGEVTAARQPLGDITTAARPPLSEIINAHKHKAEKYRQCNAELSKSNAALNIRVRDLTADTKRLLTDNISLRQQLLHLEVELNRRNLEQERNKEKLSQIHQLLQEIEAPLPRVSQKNKNRRSVDTDGESPPFLESRLLRGSYVPNGEFEMPVIQEEPGSRRSSVGGSTPGSDRRRRSSFNFNEINLPPPTTPSRVLQAAAHELREEAEEEQEEEYEEPVEEALEEDISNDRLEPSPEQSPASVEDTDMLPRAVDTRPRRRRDSKIFTSYLPDPIPEPTKSDPISPPSPIAVDRESPESEESKEEEEIIESAQPKQKPTAPEPKPIIKPIKETVNNLEAPINPPAPAPRATKRKFTASESESPSISVDFNFQPQKTVTTSKPPAKKLAPIAPLSARKALSAKSTNHDPISPSKAASKAGKLGKAGKASLDDLGKPGKSGVSGKLGGKVGLTSSNRVSGRGGKSVLEDEGIIKPLLDSFPLESTHSARSTTSATPTPPPEEDTATRPSRRSKAVVSYAMPSLRAKMRREEGPEDVAPKKKKKKRATGRRSSSTVGDQGEDWEGSQVSEVTDLGDLGELGELGEPGQLGDYGEDGDGIVAEGERDTVLDIINVSLDALPEEVKKGELEEALAGIKRKRRTSTSTEKETKRRQQEERRNSVAAAGQGQEKQAVGRRRSMMV
ncbi:hypothetical protein FPQ18DRAFT_83988 [Pyronema domesticum]|nr:hypothetical protein FPQ18DRAFT_83988 [Pyronema domesticum]